MTQACMGYKGVGWDRGRGRGGDRGREEGEGKWVGEKGEGAFGAASPTPERARCPDEMNSMFSE